MPNFTIALGKTRQVGRRTRRRVAVDDGPAAEDPGGLGNLLLGTDSCLEAKSLSRAYAYAKHTSVLNMCSF